jgi:hypothetical protein
MIRCDILYADSSRINLLEQAFWFGVDELMPRKQNLDVTISLCDTGDSACGWHLHVDKYTHEIELHPELEEDDLLTALWHEMVHVRQSERGSDYSKEEDMSYYDRPSEIEAYQLQEELLDKWKKL